MSTENTDNQTPINQEGIHICYSINDQTGHYSSIAGTSIASILENTSSKVHIHLIHDNTLSDENRNKFLQLVHNYSQQIDFYNIECFPEFQEVLQYIKENMDFDHMTWSIGTIYRLFLREILQKEDLRKCIYFDADIIVNMDVSELWHESVGTNGMAAIPEWEMKRHSDRWKTSDDTLMDQDGFLPKTYYCNAGVLLFNVDNFFTYDMIVKGITWYQSCPNYIATDQDIINYFYGKECRKLPVKYNDYVNVHRAFQDISLEKHIYHMSSASYYEADDCYKELWFSYYIKTPWFNSKVYLDSMKKAVKSGYDTLNSISRFLLGKHIIFCIEPNQMELVQSLNLGNSVEILQYQIVNNELCFGNCINHMTKNKNTNNIYCFCSYFEIIDSFLTANGFQKNQDYINGNIIINAFSNPYFFYLNGEMFR